MNEIQYTHRGDYLLPNLILNEPPPELVNLLGKYGMMRKQFLQEHQAMTYSTMLLKETLYPHLWDVDETARERHRRGVSEEVILSELVYED